MREELAGRPLLAASFGLMIGISALAHPLNLLFLAAILTLCRKKTSSCVWASAACMLGLLISPAQPMPLAQRAGTIAVQGRVSTPPTLGRFGESCLVDTDTHLFEVVFRSRRDLAMGQTVRAYGRILPLSGGFGETLRTEGAAATILCQPSDGRILSPAPAWFEAGSRLRNSFLEGVDSSLDGDQAGMVGAMCFAAGGRLDRSMQQDMSRMGAAHVLSASGMQVYLLAFMAQLLLSRLPVKRGVQVVAIVVILACYASATGFHPATIRSSLVATVAMVAYLFRREPDVLSATGLAAIVSLLWQPWALYTPGFQLSYVTVTALCLYWRPFQPSKIKGLWPALGSRLRFLLRTSLIASLAASPLTAFHFGQVSLVAPVANLLVAPVVPVVIAVALISWPLGALTPALQTGLLKIICGPLAGYILAVTGWLGSQPWSAFQWPPFSPYWMVLYYGGFLLLWRRRGRA